MTSRGVALAALAGVALLAVVHGYALGLSPQDDAFISFRYARNLLEGRGLVYNPGERVEGYTNFLWTLAMVPLIATGLDPAQLARAAGALCAVAIVFLLGLGREEAVAGGAGGAAGLCAEPPHVWLGVGAGLVLVSSSSFAAESVQGLETALYAALVTALILAVEREEGRGGSGLLPGLLGGLAALTRPEGALILVGSAVHRLLPRPFGPGPGLDGRGQFLPSLRSIAVGLALAVPHRLAAWFYYGDLLPNTFHAKVGGGLHVIPRGASYAAGFALAWLPVLALALLGLARLAPWQRTLRAGFILGCAAYVIGVGGDYKGTFRFFVPLMPLLALTAASGAAYLGSQLEAPRASRAVSTLLVLFAAGLSFRLTEPSREFCQYRAERFALDREAARWLGMNLPAAAKLAVLNAGVIPYYSGLPSLDMLGLTDRHIARAAGPMGTGIPGHEKADAPYVLSRRPDVILFFHSRTTNRPVTLEEAVSGMQFTAEEQLWQEPRFHDEYEWVSTPLGKRFLNFFHRREGVPLPPSVHETREGTGR